MFKHRSKGFYMVKRRELVVSCSSTVFFSLLSLPFSPQMRTARINTTTAMWWCRLGSVCTPITKQPAVPPVAVWQTDSRASWGADNTACPAHSTQGTLHVELQQCCWDCSSWSFSEMGFILLSASTLWLNLTPFQLLCSYLL